VVGRHEATNGKFSRSVDPRELFPSVSPLVSELMNQQFVVEGQVQLTSQNIETMNKHSIPLQVAQQYAQLLKTYNVGQINQWPLEFAVIFLKKKVKRVVIYIGPLGDFLFYNSFLEYFSEFTFRIRNF